ncbi:MAG: FAD:protein FMN transferase [Treponema sp.]|jgi:thiamine biosynthesis lipoprotein|nr:FAD:protein FMN transferase [Treponema sp.]
MYKVLSRFFTLLLVPVFFSLAGCTESPSSQSAFVLGTLCTVNLYKQGSAALYSAVFSRLQAIEALMSVTLTGSDVDLINQNAGHEPVKVHDEVLAVLETALQYAELSGGAFDPTVGPLVKLWDIGSETPQLPSEVAIREALSRINWRDVFIDRAAGTVLLKQPGMVLDLGAIAKGYAADEAARILKEARIDGAIIDLGGNIFAFGAKEGDNRDTVPWRIGVQNPLDERGTYIGVLTVQHKSIVTSGVYERYADINGVRYHHILSTKDGYPVDNGILSVTIVAASSMDADALSTTVFTLGYEKGTALLADLDKVEAVFVFTDKRIRLTKGAASMFTLTNTEYRIVE